MALPLILLGAGSLLSAWGAFAQGDAQANAANDAAKMREIEAQEVLERLNINRRSIFDQGSRFKVRQRQSIAAQGRLSDDSTLSLLEDTNAQVSRELFNAEREAEFRAQGLRSEAGFARSRADELRNAGALEGVGTLLTAGFSAYQYGGLGKKPKINQNKYSLSTWDLNTKDVGNFGYGGMYGTGKYK